jgi:hypothetical protein
MTIIILDATTTSPQPSPPPTTKIYKNDTRSGWSRPTTQSTCCVLFAFVQMDRSQTCGEIQSTHEKKNHIKEEDRDLIVFDLICCCLFIQTQLERTLSTCYINILG